jgi:ribonuclease P protein component
MKKATKETISQTPGLRKRAEFLRVQNGGMKWVSPGVILMAAPADGESVKFGLTVTKKLSKSAVVRNRIRRRLRAAAYDILPRKAKAGVDYVLIARPESETIPYEKLCSDLGWCLKRLECLKETAPTAP